MARIHLGRHVYGIAAVASGIITLRWHRFNDWPQIQALGKNFSHLEILAWIAAAILFFGGIGILWPKTARAGAIALGSLYLVFASLTVRFIVEQPRVYNSWGNFFEQFSLATGALVVYAASSGEKPERKAMLGRMGRMLFGICVASFGIEQWVYLAPTAGLVPKWIPPGQMFWAVTTTIAFGLAAVALVAGRVDLLAARLLTAMLLGFGLLVWLPHCIAAPHEAVVWTESAETWAIAGVAWIVGDFLCESGARVRSG